MSTGRFIIFEGSDGAGKTTQIDMLEQTYIKQKTSYIRVKCPGSTPDAQAIRALLLDRQKPLSHPTAALLFIAAIIHTLTEIILPAFKRGDVVLCDRFFDSAVVYQGGIDSNQQRSAVKNLITTATESFNYFDMTALLKKTKSIYFICAPEVAKARIQARGDMNLHDRQDLNFHKAVSSGYHTLFIEGPLNYLYRRYNVSPVNASSLIDTSRVDVYEVESLINSMLKQA